jgi:GT2 family glycosyltransferase
LARLHGTPLGEIGIDLDSGPVDKWAVADAVWTQLGPALRTHLAADGLAAPERVPVAGFGSLDDSACARARREVVRDPTRVTVVIATRDRTESLLRCLASLTTSDHPAFDVVVVDSAPHTDETFRALSDASVWPFAVRYVYCGQSGLARAHNAALPHVTGAVIAFTDDDVIVDGEWVSALASAFADQSVACATGLILPVELETVAQVRIEQAGGFARGFQRRVVSLTDPPDDPLFPFTAGRLGSGANMAFRAEWLRAAGGFDAATGAGTVARGGDDLLAFLRVILAGRTLVYEPSAIVRHRHHRDDDQLRRQAFGYGVGLGAYLTAAACHEPAAVRRMVRRAPQALRHLLAGDSPKNAGISAGYPRELVWRERLGVLTGPIAYARSRAGACP